MRPLISFLIPTLVERKFKFCSLTDKIMKQVEENNLKDKVEIISIYDNRNLKLCDKRNTMQKLSNGLYFLHMDDDDTISDDYCVSVCEAIEELKKNLDIEEDLPDAITYNQYCNVDDREFIVVTNIHSVLQGQPDFNLRHTGVKNEKGLDVVSRVAWQFHLWNRRRFSAVYRSDADTNAREDQNWLRRIYLEYPRTFHNIDKTLHEYHFKSDGSSTCQ